MLRVAEQHHHTAVSWFLHRSTASSSSSFNSFVSSARSIFLRLRLLCPWQKPFKPQKQAQVKGIGLPDTQYLRWQPAEWDGGGVEGRELVVKVQANVSSFDRRTCPTKVQQMSLNKPQAQHCATNLHQKYFYFSMRQENLKTSLKKKKKKKKNKICIYFMLHSSIFLFFCNIRSAS